MNLVHKQSKYHAFHKYNRDFVNCYINVFFITFPQTKIKFSKGLWVVYSQLELGFKLLREFDDSEIRNGPFSAICYE